MKQSKERLKTKSKNFFDDEVIYKSKRGIVYLKMGVKRLKYDNLNKENNKEESPHINQEVIYEEFRDELKRRLKEGDMYEKENNE